ncbi:membrane-like protein [Polaribacter sp. SA4-10]|uniref:DUF2157 domain-containing protein n=1 Tax=Polaribacter sp. SA4-10 TaxID=754397 RepID=UPI000B3CE051|nr:DUF2157 domain-containing protein [Polaribacter sp. SA4-10]ARV05360.1 membrane-like protein [Polaribacter sp. SA4-10]
MTKIDREDIHIINRHSNWSEKSIDNLLKKEIYTTATSWGKFLRLFFITLGIGFTTTGVLFFFAYNWADLHKFIKIGIIETLIVSLIAVVLFSKINIDIKNILLTGASILVGVLFAVFGQIYQTGANAYDFFLGWTLFITLWVLISNYAPLWLVFIILINTTLILYTQQVAHNWSEIFVFTLLFSINIVFLIAALAGKRFIPKLNTPTWFSNIIALTAVSFSTIGICFGIFDKLETTFMVLLIATILLYLLGIKYGLKVKSSFYLSIIFFSVIITITAFFIKLSHDAGMFLFISLFVIASVTYVIKTLINLQKKWKN